MSDGMIAAAILCPDSPAGFWNGWGIPVTVIAGVLYLAQIGWWLARLNTRPKQFQNWIAALIALVPYFVPLLLYIVEPLIRLGGPDD